MREIKKPTQFTEVGDMMVEIMELVFQIYTEIAEHREQPENSIDYVLVVRRIELSESLIAAVKTYFQGKAVK